jgi:hypothetical protein
MGVYTNDRAVRVAQAFQPAGSGDFPVARFAGSPIAFPRAFVITLLNKGIGRGADAALNSRIV